MTADRHLFRAVSELGKRVIWLHTYGQRLIDAGAERPRATPRLSKEQAPRVVASHPIPSNEEHMPDRLGYDPQARCLHVGKGVIEHVTPRMWEYDVSGVNVLGKWFSYRRKTRARPIMGARRVSQLLEVQPRTWRAEYTHELIDLLNVLGLLEELEPRQAELLDAVLAGPLVKSKDLPTATAQPAGTSPGKRPADTSEATTEPLF